MVVLAPLTVLTVGSEDRYEGEDEGENESEKRKQEKEEQERRMWK